MTTFSLIFNRLEVEVPAKTLSLSVESSVSLQCSWPNAQPMKTRQVLDLLCSRNVWVTRGIGCRINFTFLFDKHQNDRRVLEMLVDDIAGFMRDAPLWPQVALNAELEFPMSGLGDDFQPSFSITLKRSTFNGVSGHLNNPLLYPPQDVQVPPIIPCLQLRTVNIVMKFNFGSAHENPRPSLSRKAADSVEGTIEKECSHGGEAVDLNSPNLLKYNDNNCSRVAQYIPNFDLESRYEDQDMLDDNILVHQTNPLPPILTCHLLSKHPSGLLSPLNSAEEHIKDLQPQCKIDSIPSDLSYAQEMAQLAVRKLMGGRQNRSKPGMKILLRRPTLTLPSLAPSLFSPGFSEDMSQRSQFVPTISHTLSVSLLRNTQSPSLRRKLLSLVSDPFQMCGNGGTGDTLSDAKDRQDITGNLTSRSLGEAIEKRLWAMMQHSLHRSSALGLLPPEDLSTCDPRAWTAGAKGMFAGKLDEAENMTNPSVPFEPEDFDDFEENFEDLFDDVSDERECEGFENQFEEGARQRHLDEDFEDLLMDEPPGEPGRKWYIGLEAYRTDFEVVDEGVAQVGGMQVIGALGLWDENPFDQEEIRCIENEDMLT